MKTYLEQDIQCSYCGALTGQLPCSSCGGGISHEKDSDCTVDPKTSNEQ